MDWHWEGVASCKPRWPRAELNRRTYGSYWNQVSLFNERYDALGGSQKFTILSSRWKFSTKERTQLLLSNPRTIGHYSCKLVWFLHLYPHGFSIGRIEFESSLWQQMVRTLETFFDEVMVPYLFHLSIPDTETFWTTVKCLVSSACSTCILC